MKTPNLYSFLFTVGVVFGAWTGCSSDRVDIGTFVTDPPGAPQLGPADASASPAEAALISYCPSNKCPAGHTTCPDSIFPCDVDLKTDIRNCGACGAACPREGTFEFFSCVDGRCAMTCKNNRLDCDGLTDNGCESSQIDNDNCGGCDVKCLDPEKPCVLNWSAETRQCGCPAGLIPCRRLPEFPPVPENLECVRTQANDAHCGACDNTCDPDGDGGVRPPHTYFGCRESACGKVKCEPGWLDCDRDLVVNGDPDLPNLEGNGCETELGKDTSCMACGDNCLLKGQTCLRTPLPGSTPYCGCPEGQTFCGSCDSGTITVPGDGDGGLSFQLPPVCRGLCIDLRNDVDNCGACGLKCNGTCEYGSCVKQCPYGRADCDGNPDCEVNTLSDPQNCGGCGIVCDAVEGQACAGGRCMVEPCDEGDGGLAR